MASCARRLHFGSPAASSNAGSNAASPAPSPPPASTPGELIHRATPPSARTFDAATEFLVRDPDTVMGESSSGCDGCDGCEAVPPTPEDSGCDGDGDPLVLGEDRGPELLRLAALAPFVYGGYAYAHAAGALAAARAPLGLLGPVRTLDGRTALELATRPGDADWATKLPGLLHGIMAAKCESLDCFRRALLATGLKPLVYRSADALLGVREDGEGLNAAGWAMQEARAALRRAGSAPGRL